MSKTFRYRDLPGTVEEKDQIRLGEFRDRRGVEFTLYRGRATCYLNRRGGADPTEDDLVEPMGTYEAAYWLANHGLEVPPDLWKCLRGRYEFDASGKPIIPKPKIVGNLHSDDFTSVIWFGTEYYFAKGLQAECVRVLYDAWVNKTPTMSEQTIREKVRSANDSFRLAHVFKPTNKRTRKREAHPAWGTMIKKAGKGIFTLSPP